MNDFVGWASCASVATGSLAHSSAGPPAARSETLRGRNPALRWPWKRVTLVGILTVRNVEELQALQTAWTHRVTTAAPRG
jgi:hypothetical protein